MAALAKGFPNFADNFIKFHNEDFVKAAKRRNVRSRNKSTSLKRILESHIRGVNISV